MVARSMRWHGSRLHRSSTSKSPQARGKGPESPHGEEAGVWTAPSRQPPGMKESELGSVCFLRRDLIGDTCTSICCLHGLLEDQGSIYVQE